MCFAYLPSLCSQKPSSRSREIHGFVEYEGQWYNNLWHGEAKATLTLTVDQNVSVASSNETSCLSMITHLPSKPHHRLTKSASLQLVLGDGSVFEGRPSLPAPVKTMYPASTIMHLSTLLKSACRCTSPVYMPPCIGEQLPKPTRRHPQVSPGLSAWLWGLHCRGRIQVQAQPCITLSHGQSPHACPLPAHMSPCTHTLVTCSACRDIRASGRITRGQVWAC